ncbi:hypothetical protein ACJX0J_034591, partial [Zea mays]
LTDFKYESAHQTAYTNHQPCTDRTTNYNALHVAIHVADIPTGLTWLTFVKTGHATCISLS